MNHTSWIRTVCAISLLAAMGLATTGKLSAKDVRRKDIQIAETMLLYQRDNGGWPKNYEESRALSKAEKKRVLSEKKRRDTTFDNGATHSEMKHLARVLQANGDQRLERAFVAGLDFTLEAQYSSGGWPQFYPESTGYRVYITFNDGAMIGVMELLRDIARGDEVYAFVDKARRKRCRSAIDKGVKCILRCQIEVDGKKTAWCAQHDNESFAPQKARSYELKSISGSESVGIVKYLMGIEKPGRGVIDAVEGAVAWFDESKLTGIRRIRKKDKSAPKGFDKVIVEDPTAPPLWARFYQIGSNRPIFCSRDGIPMRRLADISYERRNGYSWYGNKASRLLAKDYPAWKTKHAVRLRSRP